MRADPPDPDINTASASAFGVGILTVFPSLYPGPLGVSIFGRSLRAGIWQYETSDLRRFGHNDRIDDRPYGGGAGMVIRAEVVHRALLAKATSAEGRASIDTPIVCLSARGKQFSQGDAERLARGRGIHLLAGRYEGIDERVIAHHRMELFSVGPYVLGGGDSAAFAILEAILRLLPGVVGNPDSLREESFSPDLDGAVEYPQYTRPAEWQGEKVPAALLSGDHAAIARWRAEQGVRDTSAKALSHNNM